MKQLAQIFGILFILLFSLDSWSNVVVGTINMSKILTSVSEGKQIREKLKKEFDKKQAELKKEEDRIRKTQEEYKKQTLVMNDKAREKKERSIQEDILKLQQTSLAYQKEMQEMEQNLKRPLIEKIQTVVDDVSKSADVDLTFEISTAPVVYAKTTKELSDDVIKAYNKKYKK